MVNEIRDKTRALIEDLSKKSFESFPYTTSNVFTLAEENIDSITKVTLNGAELGTGEYSFDFTNNEITISVTGLGSGDIVVVKYTYYKYSDTEIAEYIKGALVWISYSDYQQSDFEIESDEIFPTPDNRTEDLIALITSILIKPDWSEYELPTVTVRYPRTMDKDEKIEKLINRFKFGIGILELLEFD